jgi:1-acyl-sn-glycerol-3-phosphate acyltransferase
LRLVELALALEEKTGKPVGEADLRPEMSVEQVRGLLLRGSAAESADGSQPLVKVPLWPYTWGRSLRFLSAPLDLLYRLSITRTTIVGVEHLRGLPAGVIVAGTHHSFPDLPLVRYALARSGAIKTDHMVTAIAAGGFNSGGLRVAGLGLYPWYGILALGLYPLHQEAYREASLRGLARVAAVGNSIAIFPQGVHATPAAERAGDPNARFRSGVAHLARALRAPVVPFGLAGTEAVMPYAPAQFQGRLIAGIPLSIRRGPLAIAFGAPLSMSSNESPEDFTLRLQEACLALTREAEAAL